MKRLVIAVDCDDVLVSTSPYFVDTYNNTYGTSATLEYAHSPDPSVWGASDEVVLERWSGIKRTDGYKGLSPDPDEVKVLRNLAKIHELHLVTARKEEEREFTQTMLDKHLDGVFTSMEFVGWEGSKGDICRELRADVLIDDNFRHLVSARDCGVSGLLWFGDYPWQTEDLSDMPIVRCRDWREVEAEIERIASR